MKTFYEIKNAAGEGPVTITLYADIEPVTARNFIAQLRTLADRDLELRINSYGGDFFSALAIYNLLTAHKGTVTSIIDGIAASAASLIAMVGRVIMPGNSWLMLHGLSGALDTETLKQLEQSLVTAYVKKSRLALK